MQFSSCSVSCCVASCLDFCDMCNPFSSKNGAGRSVLIVVDLCLINSAVYFHRSGPLPQRLWPQGEFCQNKSTHAKKNTYVSTTVLRSDCGGGFRHVYSRLFQTFVGSLGLEVCHAGNSTWCQLGSTGQKENDGVLPMDSDKLARVTYVLYVDPRVSWGKGKQMQRVGRVIYQDWKCCRRFSPSQNKKKVLGFRELMYAGCCSILGPFYP